MRRRLLTILIFLLAGAVVNVAVAWGIAVAVDPPFHPVEHGRIWSSGESWSVHILRRTGTLYAVSTRVRIWPEPTPHQDAPDPADVAPRWSGFDTPSADYASGQSYGETIFVDACGWPALSLWYEAERDGWSVAGIRGGLEMKPPWSSSGVLVAYPKVLPLRPLWPGFAINTFFYAAILWLLIPGPFVLRRFVRVRRGLCPKCGYRVGESAVCTECGKAVPQPARVAT